MNYLTLSSLISDEWKLKNKTKKKRKNVTCAIKQVQVNIKNQWKSS